MRSRAGKRDEGGGWWQPVKAYGVATLVQNKNFLPHKPGTTVVIDHEITTRRAYAAKSSRCRRTRRG
jgi:hypothetical protein